MLYFGTWDHFYIYFVSLIQFWVKHELTLNTFWGSAVTQNRELHGDILGPQILQWTVPDIKRTILARLDFRKGNPTQAKPLLWVLESIRRSHTWKENLYFSVIPWTELWECWCSCFLYYNDAKLVLKWKYFKVVKLIYGCPGGHQQSKYYT